MNYPTLWENDRKYWFMTGWWGACWKGWWGGETNSGMVVLCGGLGAIFLYEGVKSGGGANMGGNNQVPDFDGRYDSMGTRWECVDWGDDYESGVGANGWCNVVEGGICETSWVAAMWIECGLVMGGTIS